MTDNPEYGTVLYDLLRKAERGDAEPLDAYLAADPTRAVSADRSYLLAVRHQYGSFREGRWYGYSAQPCWLARYANADGSRRAAARRQRLDAWHELTIPAGTRVESICAEGSTFRIRVNDDVVTATGDEVFRVIADCSFGPPGFSEVEIARGFDKLAGRAPLEVVGPAEPDALLGHALALVIDDPTLGWFGSGPSDRRATSKPSRTGRVMSCSLIYQGGSTRHLRAQRDCPRHRGAGCPGRTPRSGDQTRLRHERNPAPARGIVWQ